MARARRRRSGGEGARRRRGCWHLLVAKVLGLVSGDGDAHGTAELRLPAVPQAQVAGTAGIADLQITTSAREQTARESVRSCGADNPYPHGHSSTGWPKCRPQLRAAHGAGAEARGYIEGINFGVGENPRAGERSRQSTAFRVRPDTPPLSRTPTLLKSVVPTTVTHFTINK